MTPTASPPTEGQWLPTGEASRALGISKDTLKRWSAPDRQILREGLHYLTGPFPNSPRRWHVQLVRDAIAARSVGDRPAPMPVVLTTSQEAE
jgi:hypothetical protein